MANPHDQSETELWCEGCTLPDMQEGRRHPIPPTNMLRTRKTKPMEYNERNKCTPSARSITRTEEERYHLSSVRNKQKQKQKHLKTSHKHKNIKQYKNTTPYCQLSPTSTVKRCIDRTTTATTDGVTSDGCLATGELHGVRMCLQLRSKYQPTESPTTCVIKYPSTVSHANWCCCPTVVRQLVKSMTKACTTSVQRQPMKHVVSPRTVPRSNLRSVTRVIWCRELMNWYREVCEEVYSYGAWKTVSTVKIIPIVCGN